MSSRLALAMSAAALVVSLLGSTPLGHALSSALPRNSVGALQLKRNAVGPSKIAPNAVQTSHVLNGSLLTADFKPGQIPQGPKGEKGDKGDPGAPGISDRQVVHAFTAVNTANAKTIDAVCPAGKVPIGGGAQALFNLAELTTSSPSGNGWRASAVEAVVSGADWNLHAYAICAKVAP